MNSLENNKAIDNFRNVNHLSAFTNIFFGKRRKKKIVCLICQKT